MVSSRQNLGKKLIHGSQKGLRPIGYQTTGILKKHRSGRGKFEKKILFPPGGEPERTWELESLFFLQKKGQSPCRNLCEKGQIPSSEKKLKKKSGVKRLSKKNRDKGGQWLGFQPFKEYNGFNKKILTDDRG